MAILQVQLLMVINGTDGLKSGQDIILSVVDAIVQPSTQALYTWTGKTNNKTQKKEQFSELKHIHGLIYAVCRMADDKYTRAEFTNHLVYKVCKYAHIRW